MTKMKMLLLGLFLGILLTGASSVKAYQTYFFGATSEKRENWYTVSKFWDEYSHTDCYIVQSNISPFSTGISCIK